MKKIISIFNIALVITVMSLPYFVLAQDATPRSGSGSDVSASNPVVVSDCRDVDSCNWDNFMRTLNRAKDYALQIVVILSVMFIAYAGFLYLTAQGNSGKISQAHAILQNVVIGFFLAAAGWLIVRTILNTLGADNPGMVPQELRGQ